jgi:hypothetical protein
MSLARTVFAILQENGPHTLRGTAFVFIVFLILPTWWSKAEEVAVRAGYISGLGARVSDPTFWGKVLVGLIVVTVAQLVLALLVHTILVLTE